LFAFYVKTDHVINYCGEQEIVLILPEYPFQ